MNAFSLSSFPMCTTGEIIILSDDDDDCEDVSPNELSVFIVEVEDVKKSGNSCLLTSSLYVRVFML